MVQSCATVLDRHMRRPPGLTKTSFAPEPAQASADPGPPTNYLDLYGLSKPPFSGASEGGGFILFGSQRRAFESLVDHLVKGAGVVLLLGGNGIGKTEMLRAVASVAGESGKQAIMISRPADGRVSLRQFVSAWQDKPLENDPTTDDAIKTFRQGPRKALLVDDIDLLPNDCAGLLLALAQPGPEDPDGPAIILSGSGEHTSDPARPNLAELLGLARNTIQMSRLGPAEVRQYIERSLWVAGGTTRRLIAPDAMKVLVARSNGLPGTVNRLLEAALTAGFARGEGMITGKTVTAAVGPTAPRPKRGPSDISGVTAHALQIVAVGLLVTGSSVFLYKALHGPAEPPVPAKPATRQVAKVPAVAAPLRDQAQSAKPADALAPDLIAALMKRGDQLLELGDTAAARLLFQRAAEAGDATAATALGKTFDPGFAAPGNARDPGRAAEWYRKAIALGDPRAADLLKRLGVR